MRREGRREGRKERGKEREEGNLRLFFHHLSPHHKQGLLIFISHSLFLSQQKQIKNTKKDPLSTKNKSKHKKQKTKQNHNEQDSANTTTTEKQKKNHLYVNRIQNKKSKRSWDRNPNQRKWSPRMPHGRAIGATEILIFFFPQGEGILFFPEGEEKDKKRKQKQKQKQNKNKNKIMIRNLSLLHRRLSGVQSIPFPSSSPPLLNTPPPKQQHQPLLHPSSLLSPPPLSRHFSSTTEERGWREEGERPKTDTIFAASTAAGKAALSVFRITGPQVPISFIFSLLFIFSFLFSLFWAFHFLSFGKGMKR